MKTRYDKHTWPEIKAADKDRVVILPVGATEDHGPHMVLDTDTLIVTRIAEGVAQAIPEDALLMPSIPYGFNEHHKDFPGVIYIQPETLIDFIVDITRSLAHHGFRRILLLNGHGSNHPVLDLAARKTVIETECICVSASYWNLIKADIAEHRKSPMGGIAHGGEMEASMYLHFDPEHIYLDRAERQIVHSEDSRFFSLDLADGGKAMLMRWWSAQTPDGTMGDPTIADAARGKAFYDAAVRETAGLVREIRHLPILPRTDHH